MAGENLPESQLRASDADRDRVAGLLGEALADGRLTAEEHTERIDRLYAAKTHGELVPLTADLGETGSGVVRRKPNTPAVERVRPQVAVLSQTLARPTGTVEGNLVGAAVLGSARIDLTHATVHEDGLRITANAILGSIDIVVPADARVKMTGVPLLGQLNHPYEPGPVDGPPIEVKAFTLMGMVTIHRAEPENPES